MSIFTELARLHVEEIRSQKFSIGKEESNPLTQDLHQAVTSLSAELYTKDVHFLMELIQNAEDNEYEESVEPTLEFLLTKEDIIGSGSPATLLIFNNEVGFSKKNMESLCSVGRSTKKGKRKLGFIGEKGIGFKSVFLVSAKPHIFSSGYQVRFCEDPDPECGIGYIVPEWVSEKPNISDIHGLYGFKKRLPTTILVLPLKAEKVEAVEAQLFALHPEILLFLSKIKRLSVQEDEDRYSQQGNSISIVSVSSESNCVKSSSITGADSRIVQLSVQERGFDSEESCKYFMWRQEFPVKPENRVSTRADVNQWVVSLAFPFGKRLTRGISSVGVFAFLPTAMVTNFPFVIQADFILASSREYILSDNLWNLGILEVVPIAFVNAFRACLKFEPWFSSPGQIFEFLPAQESSYSKLNIVRDSIRNRLQGLNIVPYEFFNGKRYLAKPCGVIRVLSPFRNILSRINMEGGSLAGLKDLKKVLYSSLDIEKYNVVLDFLGVNVKLDWYAKCIESCDLVSQASAEVYVELLNFVSENQNIYNSDHIQNMNILRYTNREGHMRVCSISQLKKGELKVRYASESDEELHAWLGKCNMEFGCPDKVFFLPNDTHKSLLRHRKSSAICSWLLKFLLVSPISAYDYAFKLCSTIPVMEIDRIIQMAHFLYFSDKKKYIGDSKLYDLCFSVPIIDGSGHVLKYRTVTLVPASKSKWVKLFGHSNPYLNRNYVDIGNVYSKGGSFLGEPVPDKAVLDFICKYSKAKDLPELQPPNVDLRITSSKLSMEQAFLLLDWVRFLRIGGSNIPEKFISSIKNGKWMKTHKGYNSPLHSILPDMAGTAVYDMVKDILNDVSVIDQDYYGGRISNYQDELRFLGVGFGSDDVQRVVINTFTSLAATGIRREWIFSLLMFIGFLKQTKTFDAEWLRGMKKGKWMKSLRGFVSPEECVFLDSTIDADSFSRITGVCVVDEAYYGAKVGAFLSELKLLGVKTDMRDLYKLVAEKANFPSNGPTVNGACGLLILLCIRFLGTTDSSGMIQRIKAQPWLRTTSGFKSPSESTLPNSRWISLTRALKIPVVDDPFYEDKMGLLSNELRAVGVAVDVDSIILMIATKFKYLLNSSNLTPGIALSVLSCFKELRQTLSPGYPELHWLLTEKWLKTRHDYKAPNESILFSLKWGSISSFVDLPLIDDGFYGIVIYRYKDELQMLGVITDFEAGAELVLQGFQGPIEPEFITASGTIALLGCLRSAMSNFVEQSVLNNFLQNIAKSKFLKTIHGYLVPEECVLYDLAWKRIMRKTDVPCLDEEFYGADLSMYEDQLRSMGVKIDPSEVCSCIFQVLFGKSDTASIKRLYKFLWKFDWSSEDLDEHNSRVWIPENENDTGKWVKSELCVLHDTDSLFDSRLYALESYYTPELLPLFSSAFGVRKSPSFDEYLQLWNDWGLCVERRVSHLDCYSVWEGILKNLIPETEEILGQNLIKVPAVSCVDDEIHLVNKENAFIPDDLRLKKIFSNVSAPLFVWFPKHGTSAASISRKLFEIYSSLLGVKKASESVTCTVNADPPENPMPRDGLIEKGLIKIAMAFLSSPRINMPAKEIRERLESLLKATLFESHRRVKVTHVLTLTQNETVQVETEKMVYWDKNSGNLVISGSGHLDRKNSIEFASSFSEEIAEGLLPKGREAAMASLSRIIHIGFMYEFDNEAVEFLLLRENLELRSEDEKFLSNAYSAQSQSVDVFHKRKRNAFLQLSPLTPPPPSYKKKKELKM